MEEDPATTTATLSTPLLSPSPPPAAHPAMASASLPPDCWPADQAGRARLYIPEGWDPYRDDEPGLCFFRLDGGGQRGLLAVISAATGETLDVIDPADVTGVRVDVELVPQDGDGDADRQEQERLGLLAEGSGRGAAQARARGGPSAVANEPASEVPADTQAGAVLTLYVYPRRDLSKESIFSPCMVSKRAKKPNRDHPAPLPASSASESPSTKRYGHRYPNHRRYAVAPAEDLSDLCATAEAIRRLAACGPSTTTTADGHSRLSQPDGRSRRRLLVIANPFSGHKKAAEVYANTVRPMLEEAGVEHDYMATTHAGHAKERMREREPEATAAASAGDGDAGGGDGSGPSGRPAADLSEYTGVVCIGGDGLVYEVMQGIHGRSDRDEILKTVQLGMVGTGTNNGLSATLAHASEEKFSPLDYAFMVAKGDTSWLDLSLYQTTSASYTSFMTFCWGIIAEIDIESEVIRWVGVFRNDLWGAWRTLCLRKYRARFSYLPPGTGDRTTMVELPPLDEPLPEGEGWVVEEDDFILFWASQVSHAGEAMVQTPQCAMDDGVFHIFIVRGSVSRLRLALILIAMAHSGHVDMPGVEFVKCSAYRLEPITPGSFNDLDGEVIESGPVQAAVVPSAIQVFCNR